MEYKLSQIAQITGGRLVGEDCTVRSVATDSRNYISEDAVFAAISGVQHDGHNYINSLLKRSVICFIVERLPVQTEGGSYVVVDNTLAALQEWAAYHRRQFKGKIIAITGSNGKTMTKEWFAQLWSPNNGKLFRSPRSYNSQLGVALSLLMIQGDESYALIEAGISKPGEMDKLHYMIKPDFGLLTNIGDAHLQNFESRTHLYNEKMKLFGCMDDENSISVMCGNPLIKDVNKQNVSLIMNFFSMFSLECKELKGLNQIAMRLELRRGILGSLIINDSYINDFESLRTALDYQKHQNRERNVLIFSDYSEAEDYKPVAELVRDRELDLFVGIGTEIAKNKELFPTGALFYKTTEDFIENFDTALIVDSAVLLKGSRQYALERICAMLETKTHTTVMEIDLEALIENLNHYRAMLPKGCKTMAMVKAHSYGCGSVEVASALQHHGADYLAVAFADEGVELRKGGIHLPIVVLNSDPFSFNTMIEHGLEPEIYSFDSLDFFVQALMRHGVSDYPIHIKLDTGMHRLGFMEHQIEELNNYLTTQNNVRVASIFSHLAASENAAEDEFTLHQIELFRSMASRLPNAPAHICNTAGIERFADAHMDMVRLGIGLYTNPRQVATLKTRIVQLKTIPQGDTIGYGRYGKADKETAIAIVPIGYADGMDRRLSCGVGKVRVNGTLCPVIGNVCMDTMMIDVSKVENVNEGCEVIIFGDNPTVEQVAQWIGTISYEVLTSISSRIRRVYVN